jgi:hypothetical protein
VLPSLVGYATGLDEWPARGKGVESGGLQRFALNLLTDLGGAPPGPWLLWRLLPFVVEDARE